jgi:heptosyltransferase-3
MSYGDYPDLSRVRRILVVKMRHHGDVLLSTPLFSALKRHLPEAEIDALIYRETAPMVEGHPALRNLLLYDRAWKRRSWWTKLRQEISLLWKIRQGRYDLVVNLTEGDRGAIVAWASGSPLRVGVDPGKTGFFGKRAIYTHLARLCPTPRHAVEQNLDVIRRIGIFPEGGERCLIWNLPEAARTAIRPLLPTRYVAVHPSSRWRFKTLPPAHMGAIIRELARRGHTVVVTSGPEATELAMVEEILRGGSTEKIISLAGQTTLHELGAVIEGASVLLTVDSVPLHMASALQTPVVALFGPTSEIKWGPWHHARSRVVTSSHSCRPCGLDGCGGSKRSDCLAGYVLQNIVDHVEHLQSVDSSPEATRKSIASGLLLEGNCNYSDTPLRRGT